MRQLIKNGAMRCPHCEAPALCRTSRVVTRLVTHRHYQCTDLECAHTFVASLEVIRTLAPSRKPRPGVNIPFGVARGAPAMLPAPANDDGAAVAALA